VTSYQDERKAAAMIFEVTVDGSNYDVSLDEEENIVGVFFHNTDKPVPAWQLMQDKLRDAIGALFK
jgi:hypothetical protein